MKIPRTKKGLEDALTALNVAFTPESTVKELTALYKASTKPADATASDPVVPVAPVVKGKAKVSVHVKTTNGTRVFTKDEHGADFNDTAAEFAKTNATSVISVTHDVPVKA